jgi:DHA2 family multidrug resistance protein
MLTMPMAGMLVSKGDARIMMSCGFAATALSLYYMATHISLGMDFKTAAMLRVYQTLGLAFIFIPANTLSYVGVPQTKSNQISSMINFIRNIGGSIGIALLATFITRTTQQRQSYMAGHLNQGNPVFRNMLDGMTATLHSQGLSASEASRQAYARIAQLLQEQASALAYKDVISMLAVMVAFLAPLAFIMKRPSVHDAATPPVH